MHLVMKTRSFLLVAAFVAAMICVSTPAAAQTGEDALRLTQRHPGAGARSLGMGGVGIAGIGDFGALFTNPAGLGYFRESSLLGSLNSFATTDEAGYLVPGLGASFRERDVRDTRLGSVGYVYRAPTVRGSLVFAIGLDQSSTFDRNVGFGGRNNVSSISTSFLPYDDEFQIIDDGEGNVSPSFFNSIPELAYQAGAIEFLFENVGTDQPLFYEAVVPGTTIEQDGTLFEEGHMNDLSLGGAVEAAPGVMVGLSANLVFGTYRFDSRFREIDINDENTEEDYVVVLEDGELRGFDELAYRQTFESDLTGFSVRGGVSGNLLPSVRAGVSVETPTYYSVSESYRTELETFFDVGGSLYDDRDGRYEYQIVTPWRLGGGIAFEADAFLASLDVEYVDWSQMRLDSDDNAYDNTNFTIRDELDPVLNTSLGAEYRLGKLALRGGLALQPDPRSTPPTVEGSDVDRSRTFYSAGVGYRFSENIALDLAWMQERFDDFYRPYTDVTQPPAVTEAVIRNQVAIGFRFLF